MLGPGLMDAASEAEVAALCAVFRLQLDLAGGGGTRTAPAAEQVGEENARVAGRVIRG
jgi:hypothetical protein